MSSWVVSGLAVDCVTTFTVDRSGSGEEVYSNSFGKSGGNRSRCVVDGPDIVVSVKCTSVERVAHRCIQLGWKFGARPVAR